MVKFKKNVGNTPRDDEDMMGLKGSSNAFSYLILVAAAVVIGLICKGSRRSSKKFIKKKYLEADSAGYNLQRVDDSPRLSGWKLELYARLIRSNIGRKFGLVSTTFRRTKLDFFRSIHFLEEPSFTPNPKTFDSPKAIPGEPSAIHLETFIQAANTNEDFHFFTISDYYSAYRKKTTTPAEVTEWVITKVEESNVMEPGLFAVTQMDKESARKMAKESTERIERAEPLTFLDGIPILIKEEINCVPYKTRCGTTFLGEEPVSEDSTIAAKLKEAGAVVIGLTNMHELGMSVLGYNIHPDHGTPRNPYDPNHYTGGSSSGSAAAVAAGLVPLAIGTDGGGSIRIPSALCGNVGLKPTFGRVSFGGNEVSCHSVVHAGPICSSVNDAALVYALLAGPDPKDPLSINQPQVTLAKYDLPDLKGIKIGVDWHFLWDSDQEVVNACEEAINELKNRYGAEIVTVEMPEVEESRIAHNMIIYTEMREGFDEHYSEHLHKLNPDNQVIFRVVSEVTARDYIKANKQRTRSCHFMKEIFQKVDIFITPACGMTAPKIQPGDLKNGVADLPVSLQVAKYMLFGNLTGVPGLVVPIAYSKDTGLPIGLQIVGNWWEEDLVLAVGKFAEQMLRKEKPKIFFKNELLLK